MKQTPSLKPGGRLSRGNKALLGALAVSLMNFSAHAQVNNNFADGEGSSTPNQYPGTAGDGWMDAWTATFGNSNGGLNTGYLGVEPHVITANPFPGGGGYLNFGFANAECALRRSYTNNLDLDKSQVHVIEFDFRCNFQGTFTSGNDNISLTSRKPSPTSTNPGSDSTWWIKAQGQNDGGSPFGQASRWNFYNGSPIDNGSSSGVMVTSTNVPFFIGTNYHFKIVQDVITKTYVATVSATITNNLLSFTTPSPLRWRSFVNTSQSDRTNATMLHFVGRVSSSAPNGGAPLPSGTETNILSVDNIRIYLVPDTLPPRITLASPVASTIFHPVSSNLSFSVLTIGPTNTLPASGMHLTLNGVDVSSSLTADGTDSDTNRTVTFSGLAPNTIYNATILVTDQAGRAASNSYFFDTFVETEVTVLEGENYNFGTNNPCGTGRTDFNPAGYLQNPSPSAYDPINSVYINETNGYVDRTGEPGIDFEDFSPPAANGFRICDQIDARTTPAAEFVRLAYTNAGVPDWVLEHIDAGDWANYTHVYPNTNYYVYLRVGARNNPVHYQLARVTSDRMQPNQTIAVLGTFTVPALAARETLVYRQLTDAFGNPLLLHLNGEETLRLTALDASANDDTYLNFMLLAPQPVAAAPPYALNYSPASGESNVPPQSAVQITLANGSAPVSLGTVVLKVDGVNVTGSAVITPTATGVTINYLPTTFFPRLSVHTVEIVYGDGSSPLQTNSWSFHVGSYLPGVVLKVNYQQPASTNFPGYLPDSSLKFASRGNGYSYGWDRDFTQDTRQEFPATTNAPNTCRPPDQRYATFTHLNKASPPRVFEIALPNGNYEVSGVCGDATAIDSSFKIIVEGVTAVEGAPFHPQQWVEGTNTVTVSDGRLTLTSASSGNNKINFIHITPLDFPPPDFTLHNPVVNGSTFSFSISTIARALHVIEYKNQLTDPAWTTLTNIVGTGSSVLVTDPAGNTRFYRMRIP